MQLLIVACLWFACPDPPPPAVIAEVAPRATVSAPVDNTYRGIGTNVEQWRGLVAQYFSDVEMALCVVKYESGGNPDAYNASGASGLFQVMDWWAPSFGYKSSDLFIPAVNVEVAAKILAVQGWGAWSVVNKGKCP